MEPSLIQNLRDYEHNLLIVEDSDEDFEVLTRILKKLSFCSPLHRCCDGDDALDYLYRQGIYKNNSTYSLPSLILLDLNLPGTDGKEVLDEIKQHSHLKSIPIVVFTTSSNPNDIKTCYQRGANTYILKPMNLTEMKTKIEHFLDYWFTVSILPAV